MEADCTWTITTGDCTCNTSYSAQDNTCVTTGLKPAILAIAIAVPVGAAAVGGIATGVVVAMKAKAIALAAKTVARQALVEAGKQTVLTAAK